MPDTILYISYNGIKEPLVRSQVLNYLEGLHTKEGYRFVLLTFEKALMSVEEQSGLRHQLSAQGIEWVSLPYHNKPKLLGTVYDVWSGKRAALQVVKTHDVKLLHARSFIPALIATKVKHKTELPFVNDIRGFWVDEKAYKGSLDQRSLLFRLGKRLERKVFLHSDAIVSLSNAGIEEISSWTLWNKNHRPPMVNIPTCVDLDAFAPKTSINSSEPVFGYVGSLGRGYLGREVFEFFKAASQKLPASRLLIVSATDRKLLNKWRHESDLDDALVEIVSANPDQIPGLVRRMDVGLSFIEPHYAKKASCPTKLGEYLAAGIPVFANCGIGDMDSILADSNTGVLLDNFSTDRISSALDQLVDLMKERHLSQRCRAVAEVTFSLRRGIAAYSNLYCDILK